MAPVQTSPVETIREQHWLELAEYLGQQPKKVKATLELWFRLLADLGYTLTATGTNSTAGRPARAPVSAPPAPALPSQPELFEAVEGALIDVTSRRDSGERVSDQAEVRAIVDAVMELLSAPG